MTWREDIRRLGGEGYLNEKDIADFSAAKQRILSLMSDGNWHRASEIRTVALGASEALRRLREFRRVGFVVESRRSGQSRDTEYRLTIKRPQGQRSLF